MKDVLGLLIDYEEGLLDEQEEIDMFQQLIDTHYINHLQGHYQRRADDLLRDGIISA